RMPDGFDASPCRKIESAVGPSPDPVSTTLSGLAVPADSRSAPVLDGCEFAQPRPAAPKLEHGQAVASVPSPGQKGVPGAGGTSGIERLWVTVTLPGQSVKRSS